VSYSLTPHTTEGARTGTIFIGWQTFTVTQATSWVSPLPALYSFIPASGTGFSQTFTYVFSDPKGTADLQYLHMYFRGKNDLRQCWVIVAPQPPSMAVLTAAENPNLPAMSALLSSGGTLQNSLCAVDVSGITLSASGNFLTVKLPMVFSSNLSGSLITWARADGGGGLRSDSYATPGAWTVPEGRCRPSLGSPGIAVSNETRSTVNVTTEPGCPWLATSKSPWITITSGVRGQGSGSVGFTVSANSASTPRLGAITIAGETILEAQAGKGSSTAPMVAENGVLNGASFQSETGIASSTWFTVYGLNLANTSRIWQSSDFVGSQLPTRLDGVSVNVNGKPAYIYFISPMQINALAPDDATEAPVGVEVVTPQGKSVGTMVPRQRFAPAFFTFEAGGRKYVSATHADGTSIGKPGLFPGMTTRAARPGDTILLFGTGFGPTTPPTAAGSMVSQPARVQTTPGILIGNVYARVQFAGLVSSGFYQFNVTVPDVAEGDQPVSAEIGATRSTGGVYITVGR
jgi:uncharacterized protein (TIGR03437 family)